MGYFIQTPSPIGKALQIAELYQGVILDHAPAAFKDIPEGKAAVCVVEDRYSREAAVFIHSRRQCEDYSLRHPSTWVFIPWETAVELTGYLPNANFVG